MAVSGERRRFTVDVYQQMGEAGILTEDDRVELIAGEIVEMSPIGVPHMWCVNRLNNVLPRILGQEALVSVQNPVRLSSDGEPQPDLVVLRPDAPSNRIPTTADIFLIIEVADSSRAYDRAVKLPLYAAADIKEVWLVDLIAEIVERHTDPHDGVYRRVHSARRGETISSTVLPAINLAVDEILG